MIKDELKEYLVQITVIEARYLKPKNSSGLSNPFVKIKCADLPVQTTEVIYDRVDGNWNQSFTFEGLRLSEQSLQTTDIRLEVFSRNNFFSNDFIGGYSIGLSTLYKNANHEFYNHWVVLYNQDEDPDEAQGYLLIDAFIIGPGDRPPVHDRNEKVNQDVAEEDEELNLDAMTFDQLRAYQEKQQSYTIIGRPNVARKGFQLSVYVFRCENIANFDGKKPNPFISARAAGLVRRTNTVKNNSSPVYQQKMLFPCYFPFLNDKIILRIWNERGNAKDEFIANIPEFTNNNDYFNLSKLISMGGRMPAKWINLYGIPSGERNTAFGPKITHPKEGTFFLGRARISFSLIPHETPTCATTVCNQFYEPDPQNYVLFCDIYQLKYLKEDQYDIAVWCNCSIGAYDTGKNKPKKPNKKGAVRWEITEKTNEILLPNITQYFPKDFSEVPDIFINLFSGGGIGDDKRIGYIRLKAEEVHRWSSDPVPRWLHFKPLDVKKDSPGSVLVNLQFLIGSDATKRIFKQPGITKKYVLFAHIVQGFELDPKNPVNDFDLITRVKVEINEDFKFTKEMKKGRYPIWNEILEISTELDWKLDFTPDVAVILYKQVKKGLFSSEMVDEEIGRFTVPVRSIKQRKKYPHYFNVIKNNQINGRIMAMFHIVDHKRLNLNKGFDTIKKILDKKQMADIKIFTLGMRNLDFDIDIDKTLYDIKIASDEGTTIAPPTNNGLELAKVNFSPESTRLLNLSNCFEFKDIEIRGDETFQIFPYIKILYTQKKFFIDEERFIVFNASEYLSQVSEHKKKLYRVLFEQHLGSLSLDQEQKIISTDVVDDDIKDNKDKADGDDGDDIQIQVNNLDDNDVMNILDKPIANKKEEMKKIHFGENEDSKLVAAIQNYKNMVFTDDLIIECKSKEKKEEKNAMKTLRKSYIAELKKLKLVENPSMQQRQLLLDLEQKIRDAKRPMMNEAMFYGFEDISDEYNYGRDIYKEDVYECHPELAIPYKRKTLWYVPKGIFGNTYETMDGFIKLGRETDNIIKFNVEVKFTSQEYENKDKVKGLKGTTKNNFRAIAQKVGNQRYDNEFTNEEIEEEVIKDLEAYTIFHPTVQKKLRLLYCSKEEQRAQQDVDMKIPLSGLKVRVYIYRCLNLTAQDNFVGAIDWLAGYDAFSRANAYLQIKIGDNESLNDKGTKFISTVENYVPNTLSPDFYQYFELEADLPKEWKLTVNVMSYSGAGRDNLIGSTVIDLEDRYLGEKRTRNLLKYKAYETELKNRIRSLDTLEDKEKNIQEISKINAKLSNLNNLIEELSETEVPVEYRPLTKPGTKTAQGIIEMFVEVLSQSRAKVKKPAKIERPPPEEYEIRLVIWETRNIPLNDKKAIDVMVRVNYDPEGHLSKDVQKETDVHLGCQDGRAVFNWRMKFPLTIPCTFPRLTFDIMDFNTFSSDEAICSCTISIKRLLKKLIQEGRLELKNKWIELGSRNEPGEVKGEIKIDLYIIPKYEAEQNPVGEAQDHPNKDPFLEKPKEGRGVLDFLKGTWLDVTGWKFNFSLFGALKTIIIIAIILIIFIVLFVAPGVLVR